MAPNGEERGSGSVFFSRIGVTRHVVRHSVSPAKRFPSSEAISASGFGAEVA